MGLFANFNRRLARRGLARRVSAQRLQPAPLSLRRLERRRVLDAGAAGLLLGSLADTGEYVQVGEPSHNPAAQESESVTVKNVAPTNLVLIPTRATIFEGQTAELTLLFKGIGTLDTYTVQVDWGDGTPTEQFDETSSVSPLFLSHQYLDDDPTATLSDVYQVQVTVTDDDGGQSVVTTPVRVLNVQPSLMVAADQEVDEGALLDLTGGGLGSFTDPGTLDTYTATVNWGDGTPTETVTVNSSNGSGTLDASYYYADDGLYTVTVVLRDDDHGLAINRFDVEVNNVDPTLAGVDSALLINEGTAFTLADLGVTLLDPGFDNRLNPNVLGGSQETFTALSVDWGDGTPIDALNVVNRVSGTAGVVTTAEFEHAPHTYADNGLYTVTISVGDDDGGLVLQTFQIQVNNVPPTLVLTARELEINEGETLNLFDLGVFSDPGFDNRLNTGDPSNGGEVTETFSYTIDWGDGTIETGQLPATVLNGSVGVETLGTLVNDHRYIDNDLDGVADNLYTITVTLSDDDGGLVAEQIIVTRVLNVDPILEPITATDVNTQGETTLTIEFSDPGTEVLTVWVDWGDKLDLPPDQRFVPETFVVGPGTQNLTLLYVYSGPPDPLHPAADIILSVFIRDDDFGDSVVGLGQSETRRVAISNPGSGVTPIAIDTTPQVPRLVFPQQEDSLFFVGASSSDVGGVQTADLRTAVGDTKSTTDRFLELRVIDPPTGDSTGDSTGEQSEGYRLKPEVLNDLPGLFRTLPDNRYAIYLVRTETNTRRLVIEVYVRNGKLIDPGDDSEGTRDRPPTDEVVEAVSEGPKLEVQPKTPSQKNPSEELPILNPARPEAIDVGQQQAQVTQSPQAPQTLLGGATLAGFAATKSGQAWSERIDRAVASADSQKWHRLRSRHLGNRTT